ncbi:PQQ-dependent sugar dehydrogenase [Sphingomonas montana]|uniref:PQQ-dependent sugar dehydrogenase n=1 Tax=Sphingomonas montana TaxID=1843236 RepID=UPI00096DE09F|nr:PQQ-dependent sugar dehydrogenase [Sphingomonas montana]
MRVATIGFTLALVLAACGTAVSDLGTSEARAAAAQAPITGPQQFAAKDFVTTQVARLDAPWAMTVTPRGGFVVTEKAGTMKYVMQGKTPAATFVLPVAGVPKVDSAGQGGLMDVVFRPGTDMLYFSYSEAGAGGKGVVLARARFVQDAATGPRLDGVETLFRAPKVEGNGHYSGRIAFAPDGHLFFTVGERQKFDPAQDPKLTLGKVLRLTADGRPAPGNPLAAKGFDPAVWSYGHRNLLGIAFDARGNLWEQEMGPKGGDELNLILPGRNYGYPIVSNGDHYDGRVIPDHPTRPDLEAPRASWNPVISPAGLMIYSGTLFPAWRGNAFIGGLSSKALVRVALNGTTAREAARYDMGARIREVEQGQDGAVYVLEDGSGGRLLRLTPKG